ncbi:MAG: AEC family transporter [Desulfobacteraceae bacterium]|nr:AEC family transporter [Desulfobacteraceae bacterium]
MFTIIVNTLVPLFATMGLGFAAGKRALLPQNTATVLNTFVFRFTLPCLIFGALAGSPAREILQWNFMAGFTFAMLGAYLIMFIVSCFSFRSHFTEAGLRSASASFPNTAYLGFPILLSIFDGNPHAVIAVTLASLLPTVVLVLAIGKLEFHRAEKGKHPLCTFMTVFFSLMKTPVIGASLGGFLFSVLGLGLPKALGIFCHDFGMASVPCALFAMGMVIGRSGLSISPADLFSVNLVKMVVQPILAALFLLAFHVSGDWLIMGVLLSGLPTAMVAYMVAKDYGIYEAGSSAAILVSTLLCILTIPATLALAAWFGVGGM